MYRYVVYGLSIASKIAIPELLEASGGDESGTRATGAGIKPVSIHTDRALPRLRQSSDISVVPLGRNC